MKHGSQRGVAKAPKSKKKIFEVDASMLPVALLFARIATRKANEVIPPLRPVDAGEQVIGKIGTARQDIFIRYLYDEMVRCEEQMHLAKAQATASQTTEAQEHFLARASQLSFKLHVRQQMLSEALDDKFDLCGDRRRVGLRLGWVAILRVPTKNDAPTDAESGDDEEAAS